MNTEENIKQILVEDIIPNRFQPRLAFNEEGLKELSDSIKQHGVIQPLVLRRLGNKYEIIAGERRYKASVMAGLKTVPAIISNIDDNQSAEIALVENIQRKNLTSIEEAKSYKNLLDRGYLNQTQLAEKMGVSQSTIANKLRLLNLTDEVQKALLEEKISERHARSLLSLPKEEQNEWLKKIITKRMTVRQLDLELKKLKKGDSKEMPEINDKDVGIIDSINPSENEANLDAKKEEKPAKIPNKFFNFLEDEAANMNMNIEEEKKDTTFINNSVEDSIEVLDMDTDNDESENVIENIEINPLLFNNNDDEPDNSIEEIVPSTNEDIVDPIDSIINLEPNYEEKKKEENGIDLKTAINEIRNSITELENKGFNINIDEIDLEDLYQITINIKK